MAIENPYASIMTLHVNGPNSPIKRHRVADWIKKQNPTICFLQETHLSCKDNNRLKVKEWKMILQANSIHREAGVAILISDKIDLKVTKVTRGKDIHFLMIKGILHEDITYIFY